MTVLIQFIYIFNFLCAFHFFGSVDKVEAEIISGSAWFKPHSTCVLPLTDDEIDALSPTVHTGAQFYRFYATNEIQLPLMINFYLLMTFVKHLIQICENVSI